MPDCKLQKFYLQTGCVSLKHERQCTVVAVLSESNLIWLYLWIQIAANLTNAQNSLHTFPGNFPVDGQQGRSKLATSRCNGIWETTRHNWHNGLLPSPTCYRLVADLSFMLRTCYGETWCNGFWPLAHNNCPVREILDVSAQGKGRDVADTRRDAVRHISREEMRSPLYWNHNLFYSLGV